MSIGNELRNIEQSLLWAISGKKVIYCVGSFAQRRHVVDIAREITHSMTNVKHHHPNTFIFQNGGYIRFVVPDNLIEFQGGLFDKVIIDDPFNKVSRRVEAELMARVNHERD